MIYYTGAIVTAAWLVAQSPDQGWIDYASRIGVVGILFVALYGFHKGWWVFGREFKDLEKRHSLLRERCDKMEADKDAWKEQALTGHRVAERSTSIAQAALSRSQE